MAAEKKHPADFPAGCIVFLQDTPLTTCPGCPVFPHVYNNTRHYFNTMISAFFAFFEIKISRRVTVLI
jgi:hypothetical protein